jgi:hypothetical protein
MATSPLKQRFNGKAKLLMTESNISEKSSRKTSRQKPNPVDHFSTLIFKDVQSVLRLAGTSHASRERQFP